MSITSRLAIKKLIQYAHDNAGEGFNDAEDLMNLLSKELKVKLDKNVVNRMTKAIYSGTNKDLVRNLRDKQQRQKVKQARERKLNKPSL